MNQLPQGPVYMYIYQTRIVNIDVYLVHPDLKLPQSHDPPPSQRHQNCSKNNNSIIILMKFLTITALLIPTLSLVSAQSSEFDLDCVTADCGAFTNLTTKCGDTFTDIRDVPAKASESSKCMCADKDIQNKLDACSGCYARDFIAQYWQPWYDNCGLDSSGVEGINSGSDTKEDTKEDTKDTSTGDVKEGNGAAAGEAIKGRGALVVGVAVVLGILVGGL